MPQSRHHNAPSLGERLTNIVTLALIVGFFLLIVQFAVLLPNVGAHQTLVDFDAFYIVGQLFWDGRIAEAYDVAVMAQIQNALVGHLGFMPWTYPPQFNLVAMMLPLAPRGVAYALFTGLSLAAYLWVLRRLAGASLPWILIALAPPIYVTLTIGQNAFLTGALMGAFCLLSLRQRGTAGIALGLLVIKPHLAFGLAVQALASARWAVIGWAGGITVLSSLLATMVLGTDIWAAFVAGGAQAGEALRTDFYPLFRMTSFYAAMQSLGVPPGMAIGAQGAAGLSACLLIWIAVRKRVPVHQTLAMGCFTAALVSPYLYDYDMVVIGIGLALVADDLRQRSGLIDRLALLGLLWVAGGWGMLHALASAALAWEDRAAIARETLSYGAFAYIAVLLLLWRILSRTPLARA